MKVGDLVKYNGYLALVIFADGSETLVKWLDDGVVEDVYNYFENGLYLEVISESR